MKRFETPEIHAFEGSETITSNPPRERRTWLRASRKTMRKRGSSFSRPLSSAKKGAASHVAGSISTHSRDSSG